MDHNESGFALHLRAKSANLLQTHHRIFADLLQRARALMQQRKYDMAAVYAEIAASYASTNHCGLFASPELEQILTRIGREALPPSHYVRNQQDTQESPKRILHVATVVLPIGGHSRMLWRWIQRDGANVHSLALTRQVMQDVPKILQRAIEGSGGRICRVNDERGSLIDWAGRLREIAYAADLVVLHVHGGDVIPPIAFADPRSSPPVMLVNHGDHIFWLGATISNVVANLRETGMRLSQVRRAISPKRNVMLPIPLESFERRRCRSEARRALRLPEDGIMLLCIARSVKFKSVDGVSYADSHVPLLKRHKNAYLVVVGKGPDENWDSAARSVNGRIFSYPEREDTELFYTSADVYVDSFPFVSNTSLLEAGMYGLPLVTRNFFSRASEILGADAPGLSPNLMRARDATHYLSILSRLVENRELRVFIGERTRGNIEKSHNSSGWLKYLAESYQAAMNTPRPEATVGLADHQCLKEPDILLPAVCGQDVRLDDIIRDHLRVMPSCSRFLHWHRLLRSGAFRNNRRRGGAIGGLVPEWWICRARRYLNMLYRAA